MNALIAEDTQPIFRLAALFLAEHADRLGNDGCNDWAWPEWVPEATRTRILTSMATEGQVAEVLADYADGPPNKTLAGFLSDVFESLGTLEQEPEATSPESP